MTATALTGSMARVRFSAITFLLLLLLLLLPVACGSSATVARSAEPQPCRLVISADAAHLLGVLSVPEQTLPPEVSQPLADNLRVHCLYLGVPQRPGGGNALPTLDVSLDSQPNAAALFESEASGVGLVQTAFGPVTTRIAVVASKIGEDRAIWNPVTTTFSVLHRGRLVAVTVLGVEAPGRVGESAARLAVSRF
jgi:hypothetical protein